MRIRITLYLRVTTKYNKDERRREEGGSVLPMGVTASRTRHCAACPFAQEKGCGAASSVPSAVRDGRKEEVRADGRGPEAQAIGCATQQLANRDDALSGASASFCACARASVRLQGNEECVWACSLACCVSSC